MGSCIRSASPQSLSVNLGLSHSVSVSTSFYDSFSVCVSLSPHLDFLSLSSSPWLLYLPTSVSVCPSPSVSRTPRKVGWDTVPMERFLTLKSSALGDSLHPPASRACPPCPPAQCSPPPAAPHQPRYPQGSCPSRLSALSAAGLAQPDPRRWVLVGED